MADNAWSGDPTLRADGLRHYDEIDRKEMPVPQKLEILAYQCRQVHGGDPRGGGYVLVGRPRCLLQLLVDSPEDFLRLEKPVIVGSVGADVVAYWQDVKILMRCNVKDNNLHVVPWPMVPDSKPHDRRLASDLRMLAWKYKRERRRMTVDDALEVLS